VGAYLPDNLQSMIRYSTLLVEIYRPAASVRLINPSQVFGQVSILPQLLRKYLSYIDKLIIFPIQLAFTSSRYDVVHIADHGYAYYSFFCLSTQSLSTCHDLLAFRASQGDRSVSINTSRIGILLQKLIMSGLRHNSKLLFVSNSTYHDYLKFNSRDSDHRHATIYSPLNAPFRPSFTILDIPPDDRSLVPASPFILMVGSNHPRKNRLMSLQILRSMGSTFKYSLVFAGDPLTDQELSFSHLNDLGSKLISIPRPSHSFLNLLYCTAHALLFPSFSEGFGWPLIEAQTCGCPVIASNTTSIPEVAGDGALYSDPDDLQTFSSHLLSLEDLELRNSLIKRGYLNCQRFALDKVQDLYIRFALS